MDNSERKERLEQELNAAVNDWRQEFYGGAVNLKAKTRAMVVINRKLNWIEWRNRMAFPIAALITALPAIIGQLKTKPKSGVKEVAALGLAGSVALIAQDAAACSMVGVNALSCVSPDHWGMLVAASLVLVARLNGKRKEAGDDTNID